MMFLLLLTLVALFAFPHAQQLPSLVGEGQGWGQYYSTPRKILTPPPTPPLQGWGVTTKEFHPPFILGSVHNCKKSSYFRKT